MKTTLKYIAFALVAVTMVACSKENDGAKPKMGEGQIEIVCSVDAQTDDVTTRAAEKYQLPAELVPTASELKSALKLSITGEYDDPKTKDVVDLVQYTGSWSTLKAYNEADVKLNQGSYSAELENKPERDEAGKVIEGEANPYFKGGAYSNTLQVTAGVTTKANIELSLANSCFTLKVTEWLMKYYTDVTLTIHSETNSWEYKPASKEFVSPLIFVNAGQKLKLSGTATKQNGVQVEFSVEGAPAEIGTTLVKGTHYNIVVDHATAGAGGLTIELGDDYTTIEETVIELNPSTGDESLE